MRMFVCVRLLTYLFYDETIRFLCIRYTSSLFPFQFNFRIRKTLYTGFHSFLFVCFAFEYLRFTMSTKTNREKDLLKVHIKTPRKEAYTVTKSKTVVVLFFFTNNFFYYRIYLFFPSNVFIIYYSLFILFF